MNEAQVRTLEQVRQVLAGTQAMEFQAAADDEGRYAWIEAVLRRFDYRRLPRAERGPVLAYLQRLSGYSRAQITRLVSRWDAGKPLVKNYGAPRARRLPAGTRPPTWRCWPRWTAPWARCRARPRPACCAASATSSATSASSGWARSRWATCTTCATARGYRNQRVVLTKTRPTQEHQDRRAQGAGARGPPGLHPHRQRAPGRPGRHQGAVPHQRGGLRHPVAGGGQRADDLRGAPAAA